MQGLTVTLGWYASLLYDGYAHGRFAHILYWNMPEGMTQHMLTADGQVLYNSTSVGVMCLAHLFDTLGHPLLAYYFWRKSAPNNNSDSTPSTTSIWTRFSWSALLLSYLLSRIWSLLHTWYNQGNPALFYFGYDVYTILDRECWMEWLWWPAYITEAVVYAIFVVGKLVTEIQPASKRTLDRIPSTLLQSTVSDEADDQD